MLKTRVRFSHKDQAMSQSVDPQSDTIGLNKPITNPLALSLLIGLNNNNNNKCCIFDSDHFVRSPKSPLEFKVLSSMADPFLFKSPLVNCCGPVKVGLSIVDSLADDRSDVVFGPALKIKSFEVGDKYPKIEKEKSRVVFEIGENRSETEPIRFKNRSFSVQSHSKIDAAEPDIPFSGVLLEDEMSEDYTCIIAHGPNLKTTHIYGDRVLECHKNEFKEEDKKPKHIETKFGSMFLSDNFLSNCNFCNKKLKDGEDIYIYRGEKAFCSPECRSREMMIDEENIEDSSMTMHESLKKHF